MRYMKKFLIPIFIVVLSATIFAFDISLYKPVQVLEMGETFTGISNTSNAVFYNPAGIANLKGFFFQLPDISIGMSEGLGSVAMNTISNWGQIQPLIQSSNTMALISYLMQNDLTYLEGSNSALIGSDALIGYGFGNFAIAGGAFGQGWGQSMLSNTTLSLNMNAGGYAFGTAAVSMTFGGIKLSAGGTYRYGYVFPQIYNPQNNLLLDSNPNLSYEATSNIDLGTMAYIGKFSVGAMWHNVMDQATPDVRIGIGYTNNNFSAGVDLEKVFDGSYTVYRKLHAGLSYRVFGFLTLYGGLSAGWFTGGLQANLGPVFINVGTYVLNYGPYAGYNYQRMYVAEIGVRN
jgi:hypothetical protein